MSQRGFGELELCVLKTVREMGEVSVRDVYTRIGGSGSYTTIMTVMSRLADKGELLREKRGKQFIYWIASNGANASKGILKRIQEKIFGGKGALMVSYLLESDEEISDRELEEIEELIRKRRREGKSRG